MSPSSGVAPGSQAEQVGRLIMAGVLVVFLPNLPFGQYILYPLTILTTWFHEMGHGLTGMLLGYDFERLIIYASGSGVAESSYLGRPSALANAAVSAGGPLAPSVIGSLLILASSRERFWRPALAMLAGVIVLSVLIWVRSLVGVIVLPLVAATLAAIAWKAKSSLARFTLQFLGLLAALSMFRDWDYLFSQSAVIGGQPMLSDTGAIEQALWLPYWMWAIAIIVLSGLMVGASLKYALAEEGSGVRRFPSR